MRKSTVLIVVAMALGLAILMTLGTWQVYRLNWKEQLIARITARSTSKPLTLEQLGSLWEETKDVDYLPVKLQGRFDHTREMFYFNTLNGQSGWNVITPLSLDDGRILLVNRGFVPEKFRSANTRTTGQITGNVVITGLARNPVIKKPNSLVPDNQPVKSEFFWKSQAQMARLASEGTSVRILPFMVDAGKDNVNAAYPIGGTTRISFTNNHLQYAGTWYGLALALLAVGSVFIYRRKKQRA